MRVLFAALHYGYFRNLESVVDELARRGHDVYLTAERQESALGGRDSEEDAEDELFEPAARFIVTTGHASTSMIQRKFKIGYTRAARLVDMMESRGIVGGLDGAKPREILMSPSRLDEMFRNTREALLDDGPASYEAPGADADEVFAEE